ncbi:MAG: threonine ammonia-lyase [Candidatus Gallimonas sp.]
MLTIEKVRDAQAVLSDAIYKTEVVSANRLTDDYDVYLKTENLQKTGSFKIRGAYYKIARLSPEEKKRGVIACSAGNHAQGVALAAAKNGIRALICLPDGAPISKVEATRSYGADICLVPGVYDDAYNRARKLQQDFGYTFIHPFDDEDVIAGQGTIGLEILSQIPDVDAIIVPIGGGGLISGVAFAVKSVNPNVRVYGVQAAGAPSMFNSIRDHKRETLSSVSTIADGIAVKQPGENTFAFCEKYVDGIVTVNDDEISTAILALIEKHKMIAEGAGATPLAAILAGKLPELKGKKVCCVVSGGNIDVTILNRVIQRGLLTSGRQCTLNIELLDKPGQLLTVSQIIANCGGNVTGVHHEHANAGSAVIGCFLRIEIETRDFAQIARIKEDLQNAGFKIC